MAVEYRGDFSLVHSFVLLLHQDSYFAWTEMKPRSFSDLFVCLCFPVVSCNDATHPLEELKELALSQM